MIKLSKNEKSLQKFKSLKILKQKGTYKKIPFTIKSKYNFISPRKTSKEDYIDSYRMN